MERILTQDDRIKRAEEIYLKRRSNREKRENYGYDKNDENVINQKKDFKLLKKITLQLVICLMLYCIFYLIYDTNYSFSEITINKTNEILNYDYDFNIIYKKIYDIGMKILPNSNIEHENNEFYVKKNENQVKEEVNSDIEPNDSNDEVQVSEEKENKEIIKKEDEEKYSLINPVKGGYISSEFGTRESTSEIVSTNHKGIDIAVAERNRDLFCNRWNRYRKQDINYIWKVYSYRK